MKANYVKLILIGTSSLSILLGSSLVSQADEPLPDRLRDDTEYHAVLGAAIQNLVDEESHLYDLLDGSTPAAPSGPAVASTDRSVRSVLDPQDEIIQDPPAVDDGDERNDVGPVGRDWVPVIALEWTPVPELETLPNTVDATAQASAD